MNHIQIINCFMLKLCNPNGWKFDMQFKYINLMFRHQIYFNLFECMSLFPTSSNTHLNL